jgi:hypothetical protein
VTVTAADELIALIREASLPVPPSRRQDFLERVSAILGGGDLTPAGVMAACRRAQSEFVTGPAVDFDDPRSPLAPGKTGERTATRFPRR